MNGATGGTLLGLMAVDAAFLTAPPSGLIALELVDNRTHGSADARAAGAVAGSPSFSDIGTTYPLTADFQMMLDEADREVHTEFLKWILDPLNQIALESEGVLPLPVERLVNTWARLGENRTDLLPDEDDDGVWDGLDRCPQTIDGLMVDAEDATRHSVIQMRMDSTMPSIRVSTSRAHPPKVARLDASMVTATGGQMPSTVSPRMPHSGTIRTEMAMVTTGRTAHGMAHDRLESECSSRTPRTQTVVQRSQGIPPLTGSVALIVMGTVDRIQMWVGG